MQKTNSPVLVSKGSTHTIVENVSSGNLFFSYATDGEYIKLRDRVNIFEHDVYLKTIDSYETTTVTVLKD